MNKRITNILSAAALLLGAFSCSREIEPVENGRPDSEALVFKCSLEETKTVYDGVATVSWSKGDVVKVFEPPEQATLLPLTLNAMTSSSLQRIWVPARIIPSPALKLWLMP